MIHGRGDGARGILGLPTYCPLMASLSWHPKRPTAPLPPLLLAPLEHNQPWLESALDSIGKVLTEVQAASIPRATALLGFSQGACLISEYAARPAALRRPRRAVWWRDRATGHRRNDSGDLQGTPVFLGCSDVDFHIPVERVHETATIMENMGAEVTKRIYPGFGHAVNQDEIDHVLPMIKNLVQAS